MTKTIPAIVLGLAAILSLTACQAHRAELPTAAPLNLPSQTPAATSQAGLCFTPAELIPISLTSNNAILAIRTGSGVQLFNLKTHQEEKFVEAPGQIVAAALSPDGKILAWSLEDHSIQLIMIADEKLLHTLKGHTDTVFKLRFSFNGDRLFSGSHDASVRIWDKGEALQVIETGREVLGIGVSSDGTRLATVPFDGPVELWDLSNYQKVSTLGGTGGFDTSDAVFSPDGKYLAADLATGLFLWRLADGQQLWKDPKNSLAVAFSPDGQFLAYGDIENNRIVLSSPDGAQTLGILKGMQGPVWELFFSPDSSLLFAADGREIRIWQVENGDLLYIGKGSCP